MANDGVCKDYLNGVCNRDGNFEYINQFIDQNFILAQAPGVIEILTSPYVVMVILQPSTVSTNYLDGHPVDERNMWFRQSRVYGPMFFTLRNFKKFAAENADNKVALVQHNIYNLNVHFSTVDKTIVRYTRKL